MTTELFFVLLLGLAIQGVVIYVAIRLALAHDRAAKTREAVRVKAAAAFKTQAESARLEASAQR